MASNFPNSLDNIPQFLDITQSDAILVGKVQESIRNGDLASANNYLLQIQDYDKKIVNAVRLNKLRDAILALEQFYKTDFTSYIEEKQKEWQLEIDKFTYVGDWDANKLYSKNNIVRFNNNGNLLLYLCILNTVTINTFPTNTNYWIDLTKQGIRGESGSNGANFAFEWDSSFDYQVNTIVSYNGGWWISTKPSQNVIPIEGSAYWELVLYAPQPVYPIQPNQPSGQGEGELWFETFDI